MTSLLEEWQRWYGTVAPLGHLLRDSLPERWLRFHALPNGKRYATTEKERGEILHRYNVGGDEVLGEGAPIAFFLYAGCSARDLDQLPRLAGLPLPLTPVTRVLPDETTTHDEPLCVTGARAEWRAGSFDRFLTAVADDKIAALILARDTGQVFAPYDGGADLFFATELARDFARSRFTAWLSERDDGL